MATRYWYKTIAGTDQWGTTGINWYTGAGGTGTTGVGAAPAPGDDIIIDPSPLNIGTLFIEAAKTCNSFVSTGFTGGIAGSSALSVTTNASRGQSALTPVFTLPTNPSTYTYSGTITFGGTSGGGHIYCNGNSFKGPIICSTGTTTFADAFSSTAAVTLNATTDIKSTFSTTSTITQGTSGILNLSGSSLTATTTTIASQGFIHSNLSITGSLTLSAGAGAGTLTTAIFGTTICTGTTTLLGGSVLISRGTYTSNAVTVTNGFIQHNTQNAGPFTCTNVFSLTAGFLTTVLVFSPTIISNDVYIGSLTTAGGGSKDFYTKNLYLTGTGTLYTQTGVSNLNPVIVNIYVVNSSASTKILTATTQFPVSANIYLAGSGSGTITLAPGNTLVPDVYVACTGPTPVTLSTGTVNSLTFSPGTNANWNNAAGQTLTVVNNLTLTGSMTSSLTPSLLFNQGSTSYITMAGKSLVTGTLTVNEPNQNMYFVDAFSTNAAVTLTGIVDISNSFSTTSTITQGSGATLSLNPGSSLTATTTTLSGVTTTNNPNLAIAGALAISAGTLQGNINTAITCSGTTTLTTRAAIIYSGSFTSNAITVTSGNINGWNDNTGQVGTLTCTGTLTLTSGSVNTGAVDLYIGSLTTAGANPKLLGCNILKLTGTGTLYTQNTATNLTPVLSSIEIIDPSNTPKTFTCTSLFPVNESIYLAGSGSITIGPGNAALPYVYVSSTIGASVSILTGTLISLVFLPGTNAIWNNLAGQTVTLRNQLTLTSSQPQPLLTPSLAFLENGNITMAGKSLVTGTLTVNDPSTTVNFLDTFSTNAAVAFSDASYIYTPYNFTAPSVAVGRTAYWLIGYANPPAYSSPTVTIAGGLTVTGTSATLSVYGGTLNVAGAISDTATAGFVEFGNVTAKLPVTVSCTTFTVSNGNSFFDQFDTTINLSGTGTVWNMGNTLGPSLGTTTINITDTSGAAITFNGGQGSYRDVIFNTGAGGGATTINHSNSFINFRDLGTRTHTLTFQGTTTNVIYGTFDVKGSNGNIIMIQRSTAYTAYLQKGSAFGGPPTGAGLVLCNYVTITAVNALDWNGNTANGVFYAGPNSTVTSATGWNTGGKVRAQGALGVG